jgi:hypothetical protein
MLVENQRGHYNSRIGVRITFARLITTPPAD